MMNAWMSPGWVGLVFLALGLLLVQATTTAAQERPRAEGQDGSAVFALPDWAEPRNDAADAPSSAPRPPDEFRTQEEAPDPPPIPIGGLEWLILAGAGYGAWKLRATGGSSSNDPQ